MNKLVVGLMFAICLTGCGTIFDISGSDERCLSESSRSRSRGRKIEKVAEKFTEVYFGTNLGADIADFPEQGILGMRTIPVLKQTKYLNRAYGRFTDGKLQTIVFLTDHASGMLEDEARDLSQLIMDDVNERMAEFGEDAGAKNAYSIGPMMIRDRNRKINEIGVFIRSVPVDSAQ